MRACPECGASLAEDAAVCPACGTDLENAEALTEETSLPPPQLLAQIQGLLPAEPVITTGKLTPGAEDAWRRVIEVVDQSAPAAAASTAQPETAAPGKSVAAAIALAAVTSEAGDAGAGPTRSGGAPPVTRRRTAPPPPAASPAPWVALALLVAVLAGLAFPPQQPAPAPRRPGVEAAHALIQTLPPGSRVLVAWDYEPTTQGEMQLLAQPLLNHLRQRRAHLTTVSLRPLGPAMAAAALTAVQQSQAAEQAPDSQPADIGFLPGGAAALQALALASAGDEGQPMGIMGGMAPGDGMEELQLIIELSAESAASREWIEQIASRQRTPLIIAASGAVAPTLEPFVQSGQLAALLAGYPDALAYESLLGESGPAQEQQSAQSLVHLAFAVIVLFGLVRTMRRAQR